MAICTKKWGITEPVLVLKLKNAYGFRHIISSNAFHNQKHSEPTHVSENKNGFAAGVIFIAFHYQVIKSEAFDLNPFS